MTTIEAPPDHPVRRIASGTHPVEAGRLALQERTSPECDPLAVQGVIWLFRAYNAVAVSQAEGLRRHGLSPSGFNVLMALHNTPGSTLEPCQLAERLLVSRPSMTGLLDTLQAKGLVRRQPHQADRRRVHVVLTGEGRALLDAQFPTHYRSQNALFGDLSPDEVERLVGLLRRIHGAVPPHLTDPPTT